MVRYNVHDMVEITVDGKVGAPLLSAIDFQIDYFKVQGTGASNVKYKIRIKPYRDYIASEEENFSVFHLSKGVQNRLYHNSEQGLVVVKKRSWF